MTHKVARPRYVAGTQIAVLLAVVHAVHDALSAILASLLPTVQARFGASAATLALLVATVNFTASIAQPAMGAMADRVGERRMIATGVAVTAVAMGLLGRADSVSQLVALLAVAGLGSAALHPVATSIVGGSAARHPGRAIGLFTAGGMTGAAVGPVVVLAVVASYSVEALAWLMVPGLLLAVIALRTLPDWEPHGIAVMRRLRGPELLTRRMVLLTASSVLANLGFLTFLSAAPLWLVHERQVSSDAALLGWVLAVVSVAAGVGALAGGSLAPRLGHRAVAVTSLLLSAVPLIAFLHLPVGAPSLIAAALAGLLIYASQPLLVLAAQTSAPSAPAAAAGVVMGLGNAVAALLYIGSGWLQDAIGMTGAMSASFVLLVPAALLAHRAMRS